MRRALRQRQLAAVVYTSAKFPFSSRIKVHQRSILTQNRAKLIRNFKEDPYNHTGGHWLQGDALQKEARHVQFDFARLCEKVLLCCPGATTIIDCEKQEGGFNRSFIFSLNNNQKIVAKIPSRVAGPPCLTTNSEVATMSFVSSTTSIPIPKVFDSSGDPLNDVGTEYVIMEFIDGIRLSDAWGTMSTLERMQCTETLSEFLADLTQIDFSAYGSLYFSGFALQKCFKVLSHDDYQIGPQCRAEYWKCGAGELELFGDNIPNPGPWRDISHFVDGLMATAHSRIPLHGSFDRPEFRGSKEVISKLLGIAQCVMAALIKDGRIKEAAYPVLTHPDFNTRNILVAKDNPGKVVGVIDWQGASIEPAFMSVLNTPDFATDLDMLLPLPINDDDDGRERKSASICARTFDAVIGARAPKIRAARALDESMIRIFRYCIPAWVTGTTALRQELITLSQEWKSLRLDGVCPYNPTSEDLVSHEKLYSDLQDTMRLKSGLMQVLNANADGYVQTCNWQRAESLLPELRRQWIESAVESGTSEKEAKAMFPFGEVEV